MTKAAAAATSSSSGATHIMQHQHQPHHPHAHSSSTASATATAHPSHSDTIFSGLSRYQKLEKLGEGNYGCVYKARDRARGGRLVALKKIKIDDEDEGVPSTALREVAILQDLSHQHIVRLEQVIFEHGQLYLVFEYLDLDLRRYLDNIHLRKTNKNQHENHENDASHAESSTPKGLALPLVKSYVYQILLGVEYMHSHRHLHRDLKPQNLLIDRNGRLQIADLGLARAISMPMPPLTHEVATLWYRAPEILLGSKPYSNPVDLWSVGTIMAEMISLAPSFPGDSEIDTLFKIFQCIGTPTEENWPGVSSLPDYHSTFPSWSVPSDAKFLEALHIRPEHGLDSDGCDLLRSLLRHSPSDRLSARQALQHPWFLKDGLHCMTRSAKTKLEAHAARVAKRATEQAAAYRAAKMAEAQKAKEERRRQQAEDGGEDEEEEPLSDEEEFEPDDMPMVDEQHYGSDATEEDVDDEEEVDDERHRHDESQESAGSSASNSP